MKGIRVLKAFDEAGTHLTLSDLATLTGLDRASVRRMILTLVHLGYARKQGRQFTLTPRVLTLAGGFLQGNSFATEVQPLLNRYAERTEGSVSLAIRDEDAAVYIAQSALQTHAVSFGLTVGSRLPLMHTAVGRMILAYEDAGWAEEFVASTPIKRYTPRTQSDKTAIIDRISEVRAQGFAIVVEEFEAGVTDFAAPIGVPGAIKAVVGTSYASAAAGDRSVQDRIIASLQQLAREMSHTRLLQNL